ncbi:hypothetical protein GCM10010399_82530 [Dactylosporangium fulvum]|uniref:Tail terminator n=1 Tax=Dactylosporangium fulvum TaxID=53359 RepID=A0ABY5W9V1_9ACTN|nr:hypothetical protein [Dactylosporangium fulvum]UWP85876.1 hypothetical protein Dfulv_17155 [Dactylosporangium fulvum]
MAGYVTAYALLKAFLAELGETDQVAAFKNVHRRPPGNLAHNVPLLVVVRFGGTDDKLTIDRPRIQIDVFASTEDTAERLGEDVRAALRTKLPRYMHGGAVVGRVETLSAPQLLPWSASAVFRTSARYQLTVHQYAGIG